MATLPWRATVLYGVIRSGSGGVVGVDADVLRAEVAAPRLARRLAGGEVHLDEHLFLTQQLGDLGLVERLRRALVELDALHGNANVRQVANGAGATDRGQDAA